MNTIINASAVAPFIAAIEKMVRDVVKYFIITSINDNNFYENLIDTDFHVKELPETFRFGIGGYFALDRNLMSLLMGFWKYFGYDYVSLNTNSIQKHQFDDIVWFTISKNRISRSAEYVLEFYINGIEEEKKYGPFGKFPFTEKITSVTFTEDTTIKSSSRQTIHVFVGDKEVFTHWVYAQHEGQHKELVGLQLLKGVEKILQTVYDH